MSTADDRTARYRRATYAVDPVHSSITFAITHNGVATFRSGFDAYEARLERR